MALERIPQLYSDPVAPRVGPSPAPFNITHPITPPTPKPELQAFSPVSHPAPVVSAGGGSIVIDEGYKALGLEPTHGGYLPRGLTPFAGTYFLPQPIGIVDPAAYGFHHDWLLGVTYERLIMLYTNPEELNRRIEEQHGLPHPSPAPKQIRGPRDVGLFDYPLILFGGGIDYLSPNTTPLQTGGRLTPTDRQNLQFESALTERLLELGPGLYPVVFPSGIRAVVEMTKFEDLVVITDPNYFTRTTFDPNAVKPTNFLAKASGDAAKPPRDQMITERADP